MRLLLVDDNKPYLTATARSLTKQGYGVDICTNGSEAENYISLGDYDLIILDVVLKGSDGLAIIRKMRNQSDQTPVLILTAKASIEDRIRGLDSGADDYLIKPYDKDELLARIRALLRRRGAERKGELCLADLVMDMSTHEVSRAGQKINLTAKEFAILEYLLRNKNRLLTREQIVNHVWNYDFDCSSNIVDVYIRYLRTKIDSGFENKLICTTRGSGYSIREPD
jgi:two-component system, OmpR family, copper resistance phosphate regulon response regulator CusR